MIWYLYALKMDVDLLILYMAFVTVKNILSKYIPHKAFKCNDRDPPCSKKDKELNITKQNSYKFYIQYRKNTQILNTI